MRSEYYDPLYGPIDLTELERELLLLPEVLRLQWLNHLTFAYVTFPSAKYSRYEHTLGGLGLLKRSFAHLGLDRADELALRVAMILHDVGQGPFCQAFNDTLKRLRGPSRVSDRSISILSGQRARYVEVYGRHREVAEAGRNAEQLHDRVIQVLRGDPCQSDPLALSKLLFSALGIDRLEYYVRDAHYTGIAAGSIDIAHLFTGIKRNDVSPFLVFSEDSTPSVENALLRRSLLYFRVYSDLTSRVFQATMVRLLETYFGHDSGQAMQHSKRTDGEMWDLLQRASDRPIADAATSLRNGVLPTTAFLLRQSDEAARPVFDRLAKVEDGDPDLLALERRLREKLAVAPWDAVIDYDAPHVPPGPEDLAVQQGTKEVPLSQTPVGVATRAIEDRLVMLGLYCGAQCDPASVRRRLFTELGLEV